MSGQVLVLRGIVARPMAPTILVVCPNPALDRVALARGAASGGTVRASEVLETPGGKGLHVALVARELGARIALVAPLGGPTGLRVRELLHAEGLRCTRVPIAGHTRATYTLVDPDEADVVEVIEPSPRLTQAEGAVLYEQVLTRIPSARVVACSGSIPEGIDSDLYAELTRQGRAAGATVLIDASGGSLEASLAAEPDLVTPNVREASELLDEEIGTTPDHLARLARLILARGARNALVTAGKHGSVLALISGECWHVHAHAPRVVNAVGCGDALVGGIAAALVSGRELIEAVALGTAASVDKLGRLHPGKVDAASVRRITRHVEIRRLED